GMEPDCDGEGGTNRCDWWGTIPNRSRMGCGAAGGVRQRMTDYFGGPVENGKLTTNHPKVRSGSQTKPYVRSAVIRNQGACFQVGADASDGQLSQMGTHRRREIELRKMSPISSGSSVTNSEPLVALAAACSSISSA